MNKNLYKDHQPRKRKMHSLKFKTLLVLIVLSFPNFLKAQWNPTAYYTRYNILDGQGGGQGEYIRNLKYNTPDWGITFNVNNNWDLTITDNGVSVGWHDVNKLFHVFDDHDPAIRFTEVVYTEPPYGESPIGGSGTGESQETLLSQWDISANGDLFSVRQMFLDSIAAFVITPQHQSGIGMMPAVKLDVAGPVRARYNTSNNYTEMGHDGVNSYLNKVGTGNLDFRTNGQTLMRLLSTGNVGIGVTNPSTMLEVAGSLKADGFELQTLAPNNITYRSTSVAANITGQNNTNVGADAGLGVSSGSGNSNFGFQAGKAVTTGHDNTNLGNQAGFFTGTGSNNTCMGAYAGLGINSGNGNVAIGSLSGGVSGINHSVFLGYNAGRTLEGSTLNQQIVDGRSLFIVNNQSSIKHPLLFGYFGKTVNHEDPNQSFVTGTMSQLGINTYELVDSCALTIKGAVHIGPFDDVPNTFDYDVKVKDYLLWVEKGAVSEDFVVRSAQLWNNWPDYVFDENYNLMDMKTLNEFIRKNKHLPGVMSGREVSVTNGYLIEDLDKQLLKKLEEVVLYSIQKEEKIQRLTQQVELLIREVEKFKTSAR